MSVTSSQANPFPPLTISAAGMCTSLGGMVAGCAAARGGILRIMEMAPPEDPGEATGQMEPGGEGVEPVVEGADAEGAEEASSFHGHRVRDIPEEVSGLERLSNLATLALEDLLSGLTDPARELGRYAFILCLPSGYLRWAHSASKGPAPEAFASGVFLDPNEAAYLEEIKRSLLPRVFAAFPDLPQPIWTGLVLEDQAGFSEGVARAAALLSKGRVDSCLLGGVDSRVIFEDREAFEELGLVLTPDFPAGFIPGEGAAFLLLRPSNWAGESLGTVDSAAQATESGHRLSGSPPVAEALTQVARAALQNAGGGAAPVVVLSPVNGSPWISSEWGYLLTRVPALGNGDHIFPAGAFGEMGAADGPVAACMAIRGFARGYLKQSQAMVVLSSECGRKGAVMMRRPTTPGGSS
jgi:hypothetical protein